MLLLPVLSSVVLFVLLLVLLPPSSGHSGMHESLFVQAHPAARQSVQVVSTEHVAAVVPLLLVAPFTGVIGVVVMF